MSVAEYRDKFAQLSCYAPNEVVDDADKHRRFLKGLYDSLQLQLMSNTYPNFQTLVNHAIVIDNKRKEMEAKKRRIQGQASRSNTRPRTNPQQCKFPFPPKPTTCLQSLRKVLCPFVLREKKHLVSHAW